MSKRTRRLTIEELVPSGWLVHGDAAVPRRFRTAVAAIRAVKKDDKDAAESGAFDVCITTIFWDTKTSIGTTVASVLARS